MRPNSLPPRVEAAIRSFVARLKGVYPDARAYLYGSFARGDWLEDSDVDVVVVSGGLKGNVAERGWKLRSLAPHEVAFQVLGFTPEEMEDVLQSRVVWRDIASYWVEPTETRGGANQREEAGG